jgi:hypothetical protein
LDTTSNTFYEIFTEVLSQMDPEEARLFGEQLKELIDEQKRTQENSGPSR